LRRRQFEGHGGVSSSIVAHGHRVHKTGHAHNPCAHLPVAVVIDQRGSAAAAARQPTTAPQRARSSRSVRAAVVTATDSRRQAGWRLRSGRKLQATRRRQCTACTRERQKRRRARAGAGWRSRVLRRRRVGVFVKQQEQQQHARGVRHWHGLFDGGGFHGCYRRSCVSVCARARGPLGHGRERWDG